MNSRICSLLFLTSLVSSPAAIQAQAPDSVRLPFLPRALFWENTPLTFQKTNTTFTIEAGEKTDMFRDPNVAYNTDNAPKLLFIADSNFVLTEERPSSNAPLKIGFLAQSPTGQRCRVTFSDIHYSTRKIADPYIGE